jgi:hypothetical protein
MIRLMFAVRREKKKLYPMAAAMAEWLNRMRIVMKVTWKAAYLIES